MRNSLFFQISLLFIIFCIALILILTPQQTNILEYISNAKIIIPLLITVVLSILAATYISSRFITPIKSIAGIFNQPSKLAELFYNTHNLPSEVQRLLLAIIKYQASADESSSEFLAERKMFKSLLENMKDGILIADENSIVTMVNSATRQIFSLSGRNIIGSSLAEVLRNHNVNQLWQKCSVSQKQEMTSFDSSSSKTYIQCIATPLSPELPGSILFLFQDLTRMKQLEIIRRDFVSNVSHELRTPLASLKLIAETLGSSALNDPPATKRFLKQMNNEIDNLTQMVEELLELSRIESGRVPLEKKWVKPYELINIAGQRMEMQADRAGISFSYDCDQQLPEIYVDASRLSRVLINLMHNAIKFTPPGGTIQTSAQRKGDDIIFSVRDTGIGIPPKDLDRIFERFYKSDRSRSKRGTGLGLSISKHLVETHGGKVWAESIQQTGSTFNFSIPIHKKF